MTTTVVTETTTETLVGITNDGTKIVMVWTKEAAANDGGNADTTLTVTVPKLNKIKQHFIAEAVPSGSGLGAQTGESISGNVITLTYATGLAANENTYLLGLVFGS